jgi:hypothetical protein
VIRCAIREGFRYQLGRPLPRRKRKKPPGSMGMMDPGGLVVRGVFGDWGCGRRNTPPKSAAASHRGFVGNLPARTRSGFRQNRILGLATRAVVVRRQPGPVLTIGLNSLSAFCSRLAGARRSQGLPAGPPHSVNLNGLQVATVWLAQPTPARRATRRHGRNRMTGSKPITRDGMPVSRRRFG